MEAATLLIEHNADIMRVCCEGYTPLTLSAVYKDVSMLKFMLGYNDDIEAYNTITGDTLLMIAVDNVREDNVRYLLSRGVGHEPMVYIGVQGKPLL